MNCNREIFDSYAAIADSYATGAVSSDARCPFVGGLVGKSINGSITDSYATGTVSALGSVDYVYVGGLVGQNVDGSIARSYAAGTASGSGGFFNVGGFVGGNAGNSKIVDCYALGDVSSNRGTTDYMGGFVGSAYEGKISNCYAIGTVTGSHIFGGFMGSNSGSAISYVYWNTEANESGFGDSSDPDTGMKLADMKTKAFAATLNAQSNVWAQADNKQNGLPYLDPDAPTTVTDPPIVNPPDEPVNNVGIFANTVMLSLPYEPQMIVEPYRIVMITASGRIIPRSWYIDGLINARVYEQGEYNVEIRPAVNFADTTNLWMDSAVKYMGARGIVNGVGDGNFAPQTTITRAHFVTMLMRALDITDIASTREVPVTDYDDVPDWAREHVITAKALGLTIADADGKFNPNAPILRQEMFYMAYEAMEACGMLPEVFTAQWVVFADWDDVKPEYATAIQNLAKMGLVNGNADGTLNPNGQSTRAEGAQFFYNILQYDAKQQGEN